MNEEKYIPSESEELRNTILSDEVSVNDIKHTEEQSSEEDFHPFNYEKDDTPTEGKKLKEGDVIKISKSKLEELHIDPEKLAAALQASDSPEDYSEDKIVEDDQRMVIPRSSNPGITYTETKFSVGKSSFLVDLDKIKVTEDEQEEFFRKTLAGESYVYSVELNKGAAKMEFITKNVGLQQTCLNMMPWLLKQTGPTGEALYDYNSMFLWVTKAEIITTLLSFNGKQLFKFSSKYDPNTKLSEQQFYDLLKEDMDTIDRLPQPVWVVLVNGCRVHEQKEKLLNEHIVNEDF